MIHKAIKRLAFVASLFIILFVGFTLEKNHIVGQRDNQSAVQIQQKSSILFFYRNDCSDCKKIFPLVSINHDLGVPIQFINTNNTENHQKARTQYSVKAVPTFILINKTGTEISRYTGSNWGSIKQFLKKSRKQVNK